MHIAILREPRDDPRRTDSARTVSMSDTSTDPFSQPASVAWRFSFSIPRSQQCLTGPTSFDRRRLGSRST